MTAPRATFMDDCYRFAWEDEAVEMVLDRISERRGSGIVCELTVNSSRPPTPGTLLPGKNWNLNTSNDRTASELAKRDPDVDWLALLNQASGIAIRRWREGDPLVDLGGERPEGWQKPRFLLPPIVERGITSWFGDGGTGKSMLALAAAVSVATGISVMGMEPITLCPVSYLDWETDAETFYERVDAIWAGLGQSGPFPPDLIYYRQMVASLSESAPTLRRQLAERHIGFVVCDSVGQARGDDPNSGEATIRYWNAARSLRIPSLHVDHVSQEEMRRKGGPEKQVGNRYSHNQSRLSWALVAHQDEGSPCVDVAMKHRKGSNVGRQHSRGYRMTFNAQQDAQGDERLVSWTVEATDLRQLPELESRGQKFDIADAIRANDGRPMTVSDIAVATEIKPDRVKTLLNQHKDWFVRVGKDGREGTWALLEGDREEAWT